MVRDTIVCENSVIAFADLVSNILNGDNFNVYDENDDLITTASTVATDTVTYYIEGYNTVIGCYSEAKVPVTITVIPKPNFTLQAATQVCEGGYVDLATLIVNPTISNYQVVVYQNGVAEPLTGTWVSPTVTPTYYYVQIISENGMCESDLKSIRVTFGNQTVAISGQNITCDLETPIQLTASPDYSGSGAYCIWSSDNPLIAEIDPVTGTYIAHSAGNTIIRYRFIDTLGCEGSGQKVIMVREVPQLQNVNTDFTVCEGSEVLFTQLSNIPTGTRLNVYPVIGGVADTNRINSDRIIVTQDTLLMIELEDLNTHCFSTTAYVHIYIIPRPVITLVDMDGNGSLNPGETMMCANNGTDIDLSTLVAVSGSGGHFEYNIVGNPTLLPSSIVHPTTTTSYNVVYVSAQGCRSVDSTVVTVYVPELTIVSDTVVAPTEVCLSQGTLELDVVSNIDLIGNLEHSWVSSNDSIATIDENGIVTLKQTGIVKFTYTVFNNIIDCQLTATHLLKVIGAPTLSIGNFRMDTLCLGEVFTQTTKPTVNANGSTIIKQGWLLDGVVVSDTALIQSMDNGKELKYYAVNACDSVTITLGNVIVFACDGSPFTGGTFEFCIGTSVISIGIKSVKDVDGYEYYVEFEDLVLYGAYATPITPMPDTSIGIVLNVNPNTPAGVYKAIVHILNDDINFYAQYPIIIEIVTPFSITRQPIGDMILCTAEELQLTVEYAPATTVHYQWYYIGDTEDVLITDATDSVLMFNYSNAIDGLEYYVVLSNACMSETSNTAAFAMNPYQIKQEWEDVIYFDDYDHEFVWFQWYVNGIAVTDGTGNAQAYSDIRGLNGIYHVRAFRPDSTFVETCPVEIKSSGAYANTVTLTPNPVAPLSPVTVEIDVEGFQINGAEIIIFGEDGRRHQSYPVISTTMIIISPEVSGNYLVRIVDRVGNIYIRKLVVFK
jgi:hypothetical protein